MPALTMPAPATGRAAEHSFEHHSRALTLRHAQVLLWMFIAAILALWPTDRLLFADAPELAVGVGQWRAVMVVVNALGLYAARRVRRADHLVFPVVALFAVLNAAALGRWLAVAGGADDSWFHASYAAPLALMPLLLPLRHRVAITAGVAGTCTATYLLGVDGALADAAIGTAVATLISISLMSIALGHLYFRMVRAEWDEREALEARVADRAARVRALLGHVERAEDDERRRIGRELHDELAQLLTVLRLEVSSALRHAGDGPTADRLRRIDRVTDQLVDAKQRLVAGLRPAPLEQLGFAGAVVGHAREVCERAGLSLVLDVDADEIGAGHEAAVVGYRVVQEALTNVTRHAAAASVQVVVVAGGDRLHIEVADDGVGFDRDQHQPGFGLLGLRERVVAIGGETEIDSAPGRGTRVVASLPI